jgi:hypothetical protein
MASLKAVSSCIGLSGTLSIVRDFFGYATGAPQPLSLLQQVRRLRGKHIHVNLIRVGVENFGLNHEQELDLAVFRLREIYAQENARIGVGRVKRYFIPEAQAQTLGIFNSTIVQNGQTGDLTDEFSGPAGALDAFFVLNITTSLLGRSDVDGDCDKSYDVLYMTGSVISMESTPALTARILAHELGHYLGLSHPGGPGSGDFPFSLMTQFPNISDQSKPLDSVHLSAREGADMRDHCFVNDPCP